MGCNKKCVPLGEDHTTGETKYSCERCNQEVTPTFRYILSFCLKDNQDQQWLTAFDEVMQSALWKPMSIVINIREDTWQDELKIRLTAAKAEPLNFVAESNQLINEIRCILSGQPGKVM